MGLSVVPAFAQRWDRGDEVPIAWVVLNGKIRKFLLAGGQPPT